LIELERRRRQFAIGHGGEPPRRGGLHPWSQDQRVSLFGDKTSPKTPALQVMALSSAPNSVSV